MTQQWWAVTCGRGMERFAALEVTDKLRPLLVHPTDGKLHFLLGHTTTPPPPEMDGGGDGAGKEADHDNEAERANKTKGEDELGETEDRLQRLRSLKTAERLFVQVLAHFEEEEGEVETKGVERAKKQASTTGANPFKIYEHGGLFVMVGWAVSYVHLWEQAVRALRQVEGTEEGVVSPVSFRVSAKVRGSWARYHTSQEVARLFGAQIKSKLGWRVDLKDYNTEVMIHLNDRQLVIALAVGRVPISKRPYMASFGLRPPVAWAMARLAEIREGEVVCDPMCGVGTLLIEAAHEWPSACYVGMDVSEEQLATCLDNLRQSETRSKVDICRSRVEALPLRDGSVDAVVCDLPFGRKFQVGDAAALSRLYCSIASEALRVLRPHGRAILLTSQTETLEKALHEVGVSGGGYRWAAREKHYVKLGALDAWIHHITKERASDEEQRLSKARRTHESIRQEEEEEKEEKEEEKEEDRKRGQQSKRDENGQQPKKKRKQETNKSRKEGGEKVGETTKQNPREEEEDKLERRNRVFNALYFRDNK